MQHCFACDLVEAKCRVARLPDNRPDFSGGNIGYGDGCIGHGARSARTLVANPWDWTSSQLSAWLLKRGLPGEIAHAFEVHLVNGQMGAELDEMDLKSMGIKHPLHQRRVQREMFELFGTEPCGGSLRGPPFAAEPLQEHCPVGLAATYPVAPQQPWPRAQASTRPKVHAPALSPQAPDAEKPRRGRRCRPRSAGAVLAPTQRTQQSSRQPWFVKGAARRTELSADPAVATYGFEEDYSAQPLNNLYIELVEAEDTVARLRAQLMSQTNEGRSNDHLRESLAQSQMEVKELRMASSSKGSLLGEVRHQRSPEMVEWLMRTSEAARVSDWAGPHELGPEYVAWLAKVPSYRLLRRLPRQNADLEGP